MEPNPESARPADWIDVLADLRARRVPCAMVVVAGIAGSAPREPGARMIVADGRLAYGTIGGGNLEKLAIEHAAALAARGEARSETIDYPLSERAGQCCGGRVTLFYEAFHWQRRTLAIFGAGHVGQAIAGLAEYLACDVVLIDPRSEGELQPTLPAKRPYRVLFVDAPEAELETLPADALVLVMTHSHALDQELIARALARGTFPYVGLIGSERKWARFQQRLTQRGFSPEQLARVRCPIGVTKRSKEPRAIALSVAAELQLALG
ncbi:MAG: xanthine dehydrogenase accessory protein XdhC [Planctomycetota bacterium]